MNIKDRDPGDSMNGDIPYKDALDFDIPTLARESGQNILDANGVMDGPAKVVYQFLRLEGEKLETFKDAVDWGAYEEHLERFRDEDTSVRIDDFLDDLHEREKLDILVVEDRNTHGLYGGEIEDGTPYNALVRDSKITVKDDDTSGGSHGVGKFINYGLSMSSMVLFYSNLPEELLEQDLEAEDVETQVKNSPRLVGRGLLPDYRRDDKRILAGEEIWFGTDDPSDQTERPVSMWGATAERTAERLGLARPDVPGTSVAIVGFGQPNGEVPPDIDDAVETLKHAIAYHFWPAMEMGDLEVEIVGPDGDAESVTVNRAMDEFAPEITPFVKIFRQYQSADDVLGEPGDVAKTTIDFDFQPKGEDPIDGSVNLGVRVPTAADLEYTGVINHVAIFRGRGMVVDYLPKGSLASRGRDFHAILAAGKARSWPDGSPSKVDEAVDKFLRAAEPAEHDEWDNHPKLQQNYKGRCAGTVRDIQGDYLKEALLPLIRTEDDNEGDMVPSVSALFDLGTEGRGTDDDDHGLIQCTVLNRHFDQTERRWVYEAEVSPKPEVHGSWDATLSFRPKGEDNNKAGNINVADEGIELVHPAPGASVGTAVKERDRSPDLRVGVVNAAASVPEVTIRVRSEQLPSTNPRTGDIGAISLSATGDVETADEPDAATDGGD
ncbi:hypothetical protein HSB1_39010 [Halogranum salarium B-1]|uniref:Uncharacterized protein n=2 Tax=Halogranum rubrum TaxID=553466 RepID=J2ZXK8_9EURY|nr:hypothetical protein HSB1_39010 [Halogranum salarium B-1]